MLWLDCNIYLVYIYIYVYNIFRVKWFIYFVWLLVFGGVLFKLINIYGCYLIGGWGDNIIVVYIVLSFFYWINIRSRCICIG